MARNEDIEQIKALDCLRHHYPDIAKCIIFIANERKVSPFTGRKLVRMGVRRGVPDLFAPKSKRGYHGLWIEAKALDGRPSVYQKDFIKETVNDGYYGCFAYGAQEIVSTVCWYFEVPEVKVLAA